MSINADNLAKVNSFESLATLFYEELGWPSATWNTFEGVQDVYSIPQSTGLESILAVQPLTADQTWGIFLVDFNQSKLRRSQLRSILNKVSERERQDHAERTWAHENILFICRSESTTWTLGHYTGERPSTARLRTFGWSDASRARTALENLGKLTWANQLQWRDAWNVEHLTNEFFRRLNDVFKLGLASVASGIKQNDDPRLFIQLLLNRLLFVRFLEEKGRLTFKGRKDYLKALWEESIGGISPLYPTRLNALFGALNHPLSDNIHEVSRGLIDEVPYLNGGLFETDDRFSDPSIKIPDQFFSDLLGPEGLFYRFNFTAEESTPTDIQVAVDPEILGRIFEQLVIKEERHESGSYYTPREIVQFMCRESLINYLVGAGVPSGSATQLVTEHSKAGLPDQEVDAAFEALKEVTVVDPACGSGAYLLGMLQELYSLFKAMERRFAKSTQEEEHARKLWIIEHNVYGVDIHPFATNTAMLRLWLTLMIEDEGPTLQPLPNLDYKIERGDSLMGPDPQEAPDITHHRKVVQAGFDFHEIWKEAANFLRLREEYQKTHGTKEKEKKRAELEAAKDKLREKVTGTAAKNPGRFDWRVEFPDVLISHEARPKTGFDIVLANPPYVNSGELLRSIGKDAKGALIAAYPQTADGTADLLVYFFERGIQLIREGGQFAFISSNKWLKADYGQKLRAYMVRQATIRHIIDFGDLPVFESVVAYPVITIATKGGLPAKARFTSITSLGAPYPDLRFIVEHMGNDLPGEALCRDGTWRLEAGEGAVRLARMRSRGTPLRELVKGRILSGLKTGLNDIRVGNDGKQYAKKDAAPAGSHREGVFVINGSKRAELIAEDPRSAEIIKPLAVGRGIERWLVNHRDTWIILTKIGVDIDRYPAIKKHLGRFEQKLAERSDQGNNWWELRDCAYYEAFETVKILSTKLTTKPTFCFDPSGGYALNTTYLFAVDDPLYVLALLNSSTSDQWCHATFQGKQGAFEVQPGPLGAFPVPDAPEPTRQKLRNLVQRAIDQRADNPGADVREIEAEIDRQVEFLFFGEGDSYEEALAKDQAAIRALLKREAEDATLEFKETLFFDVKLGSFHGDRVMDVAKAICAMLNRDGGTILIGIADVGNAVVGIYRDLDKLETPDRFQRKLAEPFGVKLRPDPSDLVRVRFIPIDGKLVARVDIKPDRTTMYTLNDKVYVRRDGESRELSGVDLALWWARRHIGQE